ncbi:MAG: Tim44-like domain-containing protein [Pseudomonadota bacterium]
MRRLLTTLMIAIASTSMLAVTSVEAARLGGGKSTGMRRQAITPQQAPKAPAAQPAPASQPAAAAAAAAPAMQPKPASGMSRWLGPLLGFGLGAGLMSMFGGGGSMMGGLGNIFMILLLAAAVFFVISMFRRKSAPQAVTESARFATMPSEPPVAAPMERTFDGGSAAKPERRYPDGFDAAGFVRQAKVSFIRMQAANDAKDLRDMRDYTTPELYAELAMQVQERGNTQQKTDVVNLEADLLDVTTEEGRAIASVHFTGLIREEENAAATPLNETWHVVKDLSNANSTWLIAGIEQNG